MTHQVDKVLKVHSSTQFQPAKQLQYCINGAIPIGSSIRSDLISANIEQRTRYDINMNKEAQYCVTHYKYLLIKIK